MKIVRIILVSLLLNTTLDLYAQQITYSAKNVSLKTVFAAIQKQTGYGFFYDQTVLSKAKPVTVNVTKATLKNVLTTVFKNQALTYTIDNKTILVSSKKAPENSSVKSVPKPKTPEQQTELPADPKAAQSQEKDPPSLTSSKLSTDTLIVNNEKALPAQNKSETVSSGNSASPAAEIVKQPGSELAKSPKKFNPQSAQSVPSDLKSPINFSKSFRDRPFALLDYKEVTFGVKGGFNTSRRNGWQSGSGSTDFYLGFFANKQMTSKFHLGTELAFSILSESTQFALPVHLKYALNNRLTVLTGPVLDLTGESYSRKYIGLSAEAGVQYQINQIFFTETRYAKGLIGQDLNILRLGIGANFTRNESVEKRSSEPEPLRLRIGLNGGLALNDPYVSVAGVDLRIQEYFSNSLAGTITAGYYQYWWKNERQGFMGYFPMKAGLKYFAVKPFYISPEAGFAFGMDSERNTRPFLYAGGIGAEMKNGLDISLRYENLTGNLYKYYFGMPDIKRPAHVALRVEYGVNFKPVNKKSGEFEKAKTEPLPTLTRKKAVFVELMGNGSGVTANFDMRFKRDRNDGLGFSAGAGITTGALTFPLTLNYIVGKYRSGLETSIGLSNFYSGPGDNFYFDDYLENEAKFVSAPIVSLAYRLQTYKGLLVKAQFGAMHTGFYYDKGLVNYGLFVITTPGISLGYNFK